jgi:hypothetical protein
MPKLYNNERSGIRFLATQAMIGQEINWVAGNQIFPFTTSGVINTVPTILTSSDGVPLLVLSLTLFSDYLTAQRIIQGLRVLAPNAAQPNPH